MPDRLDDEGRTGTRPAALEGVGEKKNPHVGSTFESWLDEHSIREEVVATAIREVIAEQLAAETRRKGITKLRMAQMMLTSRRRSTACSTRATAAPRWKC